MDRKKLIDQLNKIDFIDRTYPSEANFILFQIENKDFNSNDFMNYLMNSHNIFVKDISNKFNNKNISSYRVAVRSQVENEKLVFAIRKFRLKS